MKSYTYFKDINSVRIDTLAIFHVVEFWVLIVALFIIFKNDFFYPLLISLVIHIILDIIREKVKHTEGERAHSLIFWLKRRNLI